LGYVESKCGHPAHEYLMAAVEAEPENWIGHYFLGQYLVDAGVPALGVSELERSRLLEPNNPAILLALGSAHVALGNPMAAEEAFTQAVSLAPSDVSLNKRLVDFYANSAFKPTQNGLPAALAASKLAPEDAELQDALGWIYVLAGDTHRAFLHLYTAWQLNPNQASTFYHLGRWYQATGWDEAATSAFQRAAEIDETGEYRARVRQMALEKAR
jgi:tetratricopeptide (TPR) repeat protein